MVVMLMASCTRGDAVRNEGDATSVTEISVVTEPLLTAGSVTRADGEEGGETEGEGEDVNGGGTTDDIEDMTAENKFIDGSLLYISQMGTVIEPNFNEDKTDNELYDNNLYRYIYSENTSADWDKEFNFKTETGRAPIKWQDIKNRGSVGNAFSLYALHFPVDNKVRFSVEKNQTTLDNFRKSDIMGAYHATSSLYSRMRFRLYHLMVYLRVTLYVPVYQATDPEDKISKPTGYHAEAVKNAFLTKVKTEFDIEWRASRSSDNDAPYVSEKRDAPADYVFMYAHESNKEKKDVIKTIDVTKFYGQGNLTEDQVYEYNFSVLIPRQQMGTNDQFLLFQLLPGTVFDKDKTDLTTYYFQTSQLRQGYDDFQLMTQGSLLHLNLYLPRTGNDVLLVSADIVNWKDASSDMTVTKQPKDEGDEDDKDDEGGESGTGGGENGGA